MKEKKEKRKSNRPSPKPFGAPRAAGIMPSRTWWEGARCFWRGLAFREKGLIFMGVLVPALDQISRLASIGITMKAISSGIRQHPDLETRLWLGLLILGASGISGLMVLVSNKVTRNLKSLVTRLVRRVYGRMIAATARSPLDGKEAEIATLLEKERDFVTSAISGVLDLIDFFASVSIVVVLVVILTWFNWIVGAIILVAGLVALLILKFKVRTSSTKENVDVLEARKKLTEQLERIAFSRKDTEAVIDDYARNEFDRLTLAELESRTSLQKKITSAMGFGSAILMAVVFFLVSSDGAFDEHKIVWMVVFVFGLRMVVSHGKSAMVSWGAILGEKEKLMIMAKALITPASGIEDGESDTQIDNPARQENLGKRLRIVDYSFRGLNGQEIVCREPLVLEMTVESEVEIEGFYWSFAITLKQGSPYLMSKTSDDCGITWRLPKGRSTFRMVTSPIWLPPRNYFAMIGAAEGRRLLDLVGADDPPITICVHPDEATRRSAQTREACDTVVVDVEWDLDFRHEVPVNDEVRPVSQLTLKSI